MLRPAAPGFLVLLQVAMTALLAGPAAVRAQAPRAELDRPAADERPEFLRLSRDDSGRPLSLDTSIVEYAAAGSGATGTGGRGPLRVDLVAAVHVGSRGYYDTLDRLFTGYDAVLYELVAPPNARIPKPGRKPAGAIGSAQQGLTRLLGLEYQLDQVDYGADNFVHADLSPKEFDAAMARRGESWWTMFSRLMRESMARADHGGGSGEEIGVSDLFGMLFGGGPERQVKLRRIMAEQFSDMDVLTAAFGGQDGSTLITDRNAAALEILRRQIAGGRRTIAIFYGAAHMEDFDVRLREDFGLQPRETAWLEAWDLRDPLPTAARR